MNVEEIRALVQLFEASTLSELSVKREGTHLVLKREGGAGAPAAGRSPSEAARASAAAPEPPEADAGHHLVVSPLVGTFYCRPSPDDPPYVEVGAAVRAGDTLCIVEAMKVMNEIKADRAGVVRKVLAEDAHIVEYGQPLIALEPA